MANTTVDIEGLYQTDSRIPIDEIDKSELTNPNVTNVEVILMSSLFVLTIVGNFIVIFILLVYRTSSSTRRSISRMSFYIINLSVADICVALMSILPATIWRHSVVFFSDLQVVCKLVSFSQVFSVYASTFMLIVMAYDRYMCICWPIKSCTWTYKSGMIGVILAWSLAALVSSPQLALFSIQPLHHPQKNMSIETCSVSWQSKAHEGVYFLFHMSTQFLIPLLILTIFYTNIFLAVSKSITSKKESLRIECSAPESESTTMVTSTFIASIGGRIRSSSSSLNGLGGHRLSVLTSPKRGRSIEASKNSIELRPLEHSPSQNSGSGFFKKLAQLSRSASQENPGAPLPPPPPSPPRIRQSVPTKTLTKSKIKTLKLTLTVVITYVLCTMPFYISNITNYMVDVAALPEHSPFLTFLKNFAIVTSLLYQLNSCANPFIYMIFNGNACQIVKKKNDLCCRGRNRSRTLTQTRHKSSGQDRSLQTETSELIYSKLNGGGGGGGSTRK